MKEKRRFCSRILPQLSTINYSWPFSPSLRSSVHPFWIMETATVPLRSVASSNLQRWQQKIELSSSSTLVAGRLGLRIGPLWDPFACEAFDVTRLKSFVLLRYVNNRIERLLLDRIMRYTVNRGSEANL